MKFSEEHKRKIRESTKKTKNSKEWKETIGIKAAKKRSESLKGKHISTETEFKKGMKIPQDWKKKWNRKGNKNPRFKYDEQEVYILSVLA